ncbi:unnamed protein product [Phaedon cochleariae]|uniref:Aldehyde dehydrogenase n=1 Tax=Phaedon cochleariae TaxID=80249 RepID=A0A9N9S7T9_PHACE|nr:unnamed protein product [Phaedon cochleariae]
MIPRAKLSNAAVIDVENVSAGKNTAKELVENTRKAFRSQRTLSYSFRREQLRNLLRFFDNEAEAICEALYKDLKKPKAESMAGEICMVRREVAGALSNLKSWMEPEEVKKTVANFFDDLYVYNDPYGVVLVIGAWNYPVQVCMIPVVGAIAAGNCVIIKPSEVASATAQTLATLLPKYLDPEFYPVFLGGIEETADLLKNRFDYIFYTGSTEVGKIIHQAASKYLTPITLELGGKSPVYIDNTANLKIAAKRILWGKVQNSGQICVGPDYILCTKEVQKELIPHMEKALEEFFDGNIKTNEDYGRIVSQKHFNRLANMLKNQKAAIGGKSDESDLFVEPTVLIDVKPEDHVMQEEVFGPIISIINVKDENEAIEFINDREKPLALYIFTNSSKVKKMFLERTSSGGVLINDTVMHLIADGLPFGGVGHSGMGSYHGKKTFDTFVHKKSVLSKSFNLIAEKIESLKYPPYTKFKSGSLALVMRYNRSLPTKYVPHLCAFVLGIAATVGCYYLKRYVKICYASTQIEQIPFENLLRRSQ